MARGKRVVSYIPIGGDYRISLDGLNVTVSQRKNKSWRAIGYYSSYRNALEGLVEHAVRQPDLKDLKEVVRRIDELYQLIESLKTPQGFVLKSNESSLLSTPLSSEAPTSIKTRKKQKRGLKSNRRRSGDIVSRKAVVGMLGGGNGKRERKSRKGS